MRDAHLAENIFQTRSSNNFKRRQEIRLISYIKGTVAYKGKDSVVIENHGIGYQIKVPSRVLEGVNSGEEAMLHTYLYVREDQLALFGFSSIQDFPDSAWNFRHRTESRIIGTFHDVSGRFVLCGF